MGALVCRIELNKQEGLTLTVENKDGGITQTVVLGNDSITLTSAGDKETSTITQTPDAVSINCKHFSLESETITCKATQKALHESAGTCEVRSDKDMTLTTKGKLTQKADLDVDIAGQNCTVEAMAKVGLSGMDVKVDGTSKAQVGGGQLGLAGQIKTEVKGAIIEIKSDGILTVDGQLTTIKGKKLSAEGLLTNIG